jgi:hypothetical protein
MNGRFSISFLLAGAFCFAAGGPKGGVPRSSASLYAAHAEQHGTAIGATLIKPQEAQKAFVSPVNRCCTVIEVAIFPAKDHSSEISLNDFVLRVEGTDTALKPSSAKVVAGNLRKKAEADRDISVSPIVGVGYGTGGYDPVTGRRGGFEETAGVAVTNGGQKSGSTEKDRSAMEAELSEKSLPEGTASGPVAGYIYFPIANKKSTRVLEYTLNGKKMVLTLQ